MTMCLPQSPIIVTGINYFIGINGIIGNPLVHMVIHWCHWGHWRHWCQLRQWKHWWSSGTIFRFIDVNGVNGTIGISVVTDSDIIVAIGIIFNNDPIVAVGTVVAIRIIVTIDTVL